MTKQAGAADHAAEIHKATSAEIARRIRAFVERSTVITRELADRYSVQQKAGRPQPSPPPREEAAMARAREIAGLNGATPRWLMPRDVTASPDETLWIERAAIELVLRALGEKQTEARAAESLIWVEENADRWRALCKEIILTAAHLQALELSARAMLGENIVPGTPLPMGRWMGSGVSIIPGTDWTSDPMREGFADAIEQGVVTAAELARAKG